MKTLKYKEIQRSEYRDLVDAHSAIGYQPPTEFEANLAERKKEAATRCHIE